MRIFIVGVFAVFAAHASGAADGPKNPRAVVFLHQCQEIDPAVSGFSCAFDRDGLRIHWQKKTSDMTAKKRQRARYDFSRIALRYIELGGRRFTVRFAHWPPGQMRTCWRRKNVKYPAFWCTDPH